MPAALGVGLVLQHDGVRARPLQQLDGASRVDRVAKAGVAVGQDRNADDLARRRNVGGQLGHRCQPEIGHAEKRIGDCRPADQHHLVAGRLDNARGQRVSSPGHEMPRARDQLAAHDLVKRLCHVVVPPLDDRRATPALPFRCKGPHDNAPEYA